MPAATCPLRHQVLWPDKPLDYVKVENDEAGQHFGAFLAEAPYPTRAWLANCNWKA